MTSQLSGPHSFARATAVKQLSSHVYSADFPDEWCIGSVPHGGYVTSCFLQVASKHFSTTLSAQNQPHTITLHLDFLRRTNTGPAKFTVKDVKLGRQTSVIHVTLAQGDPSKPREEVVGFITNSNISTESGLTLDTRYRLVPPPPPVDFTALKEGHDANWALKEDMPFASWRKASQKVKFYFPQAGQVRGIGDEWLCFRNGERFTNASLGYVADIFPMPAETLMRDTDPYDVSVGSRQAENLAAKQWYPTLVLNMDIKKSLPEEGVEWLFARVTAKRVRNGRMDLEIIILDKEGDIIALSHHVALAVSADRNIAKRNESIASKI